MRKNIFGTNVTDKTDLNKMDGDRFITNSISHLQRTHVLEGAKLNESIPAQVNSTWFIGLIRFMSGFGAIGALYFALTSFLRDEEMFDIDSVYLALAIAIILGVTWYGVRQYEKKYKQERINEIEESEDLKYMLDVVNNSKMELGIPNDAIEMDLLISWYKIKKDARKVVKMIGMFEFGNMVHFIYLEDDMLHIADIENVYSIPVSSITGIHEVSKKFTIQEWNKEQGFNEGPYKQYNIKVNQFGIIIKKRYEVHIDHDGEEFMLLVPEYDIDAFNAILKSNE